MKRSLRKKRRAADPLKARWRDLSPTTARMVETLARAIGKHDVPGAQMALVAALASAPEHPEVQRLHGLLCHLRGQYQQAIEVFHAILADHPDDALVYNNLGSALRAAGQHDAAVEAWKAATEKASDLAAAWYNLGKHYRHDSHTDAAREALERAVSADPRHAGAWLVLGGAYKDLGQIGKAEKAFREVLKHQPGSADAWYGLANLKTVRFTTDDARQLEHHLQQPGQARTDQVTLGFALSKALEDNNRYEEAFAALEKANALQRKQIEWDGADFNRRMRTTEEVFSQPLPAAPADQGGEVIFIACLPRSGSTLTEQIISSHPDVEGANELPDLSAIITEESERRGKQLHEWASEASADDWQRLGQEYLRRTERWRKKRPRFTDKSLRNWPLIGAALQMLPAARVIICRRDPLETCLACYRQYFALGCHFSYDPDDMAGYWHAFDQLSRFWQQRYPEQVGELVHEELLADPEAVIRRLLDDCNLTFDPACLHPEQSQRSVRTASAAQVRQPLRRSTARAHLYGEALDGMRMSLTRVTKHD